MFEILRAYYNEVSAKESQIRIPEPMLMDNSLQAEAYHQVSSDGCAMDSVHLFHLSKLSKIIEQVMRF